MIEVMGSAQEKYSFNQGYDYEGQTWLTWKSPHNSKRSTLIPFSCSAFWTVA
jgi:hypothetical protein